MLSCAALLVNMCLEVFRLTPQNRDPDGREILRSGVLFFQKAEFISPWNMIYYLYGSIVFVLIDVRRWSPLVYFADWETLDSSTSVASHLENICPRFVFIPAIVPDGLCTCPSRNEKTVAAFAYGVF